MGTRESPRARPVGGGAIIMDGGPETSDGEGPAGGLDFSELLRTGFRPSSAPTRTTAPNAKGPEGPSAPSFAYTVGRHGHSHTPHPASPTIACCDGALIDDDDSLPLTLLNCTPVLAGS